MNNKKNFIHVGVSGFPFGSAPIYRCLSIYKLLVDKDTDVLVINNRAKHYADVPIKIKKTGEYDSVKYIYTTPTPYKPKRFLSRRYYNLIGRVNEFLLIIKLAFSNKIDLMFFYPKGNFTELLYYRFLSKLFNFPIVAHYVEYRTAFTSRQGFFQRTVDKYFDLFFMKFIDGVLPISEFLIDHLNNRGFKKPYLKIPPLVDFNLVKTGKVLNSEKYILFAGSIGYSDTLKLILDTFDLISDKNYYLYLVLSGTGNSIKRFKEKINENAKNSRVKIFSNLEYKELLKLYINAKALLIPLNNRLQDEARFPHKIAEYLATGNPIITTNIGEIKYYFKDEVNALVCKEIDPVELSEKLKFVIDNEKIAVEIGNGGYKIGLQYFDSNRYEERLKSYIKVIIE